MEFENQIELRIRAFFFNAMTDYLPYYKNFSFMIDKREDMLLKDILPMIKEENINFSYPKESELLFRVNKVVVNGREKLSDIIEKMGLELKIEPVLEYRSDNGLIINNHDFMHQFRRLLGHFSKKEDLEYYLRLYPVHYASETFNYNKEYIGDAILLLAYKMIKDGNPHKDEILKAVDDEFNGISCCEYENNIFNGVDYSKEIDELKAMIPNKRSRFFDNLIKQVLPKKEIKSYDVDLFKPQNIALYVGDKSSSKLIEETKKLVESSGSKFIEFDMATKKAGQSIIFTNPEIAYKKAGRMLLEAFDNGATLLAFAKDKDLEFFSSIHSDVESAVGRDINLNFVSLKKLKELIQAVEV